VDAETGGTRSSIRTVAGTTDVDALPEDERLSDSDAAENDLVVSVERGGLVRFWSQSGSEIRASIPSDKAWLSVDPAGKHLLAWSPRAVKSWPIKTPIEVAEPRWLDGASRAKGLFGAWEVRQAPKTGSSDEAASRLELTGVSNGLVLRYDDSRREVVHLPFDMQGVGLWTLAAGGAAVAVDRNSNRGARTTVWTRLGGQESRYESVEVLGQLLALTRDGATLAVFEQGRVLLHDTRSGLLLRRFDLGTALSISAQFTDDGSRLWVRKFHGIDARDDRDIAVVLDLATGDAGFDRPALTSASLLARVRRLLPAARPIQTPPAPAVARIPDVDIPGLHRRFRWEEEEPGRRCLEGCCERGKPQSIRLGKHAGRLGYSRSGAGCPGEFKLSWAGQLFAAYVGFIHDFRVLDADGDGLDELVLVKHSSSNGSGVQNLWAEVLAPLAPTGTTPPQEWQLAGSLSGDSSGFHGRVVFRDLDGDGRRETGCGIAPRSEGTTGWVITSATKLSADRWTSGEPIDCRRPGHGAQLVLGFDFEKLVLTSRVAPAGETVFAWSKLPVEQ
jgi:hypothetical protein